MNSMQSSWRQQTSWQRLCLALGFSLFASVLTTAWAIEFLLVEKPAPATAAKKTNSTPAENEVRASRPILTLSDEGRIEGDLVASPAMTDSAKPLAAIGWQGDQFVTPFEFPIESLRAINYPVARDIAPTKAEFQFQTRHQGLFVGNIRRWTRDLLEIDSPSVGTVTLKLAEVLNISRVDGNPQVVYPGLTHLDDWRNIAVGWKNLGAELGATTDDAQIAADIGVPERALIELDLSWKKGATFSIGLGVDASKEGDTQRDGWRLETWQDRLNLIREFGGQADVVTIAQMSKTQAIQLLIYLDQSKNEITVLKRDGELAGKIAFLPENQKKPRKPRTGVRLINLHGELHLERLRVSRWTGSIPDRSTEDALQYTVVQTDGTRVLGSLVDVSADKITLQSDAQDKAIPTKSIASVQFPKVQTAEGKSADSKAFSQEFRIALQDGSQLGGTLGQIDQETITIISPDTHSPIQVARSRLRLITRTDKAESSPKPAVAASGRVGELELGPHRLKGRLIPSAETGTATCFSWHPLESSTASSLKSGISARIIYRERPEMNKVDTKVATPKTGGNFGKIFLNKVGDPPAKSTPKSAAANHKIHLRSGDIIPGTVSAAGEEGVSISSPIVGERVIPHAKIKAIELVPSAAMPKLKKAKKERLLMVPRAQTGSPPTHLLCAKSGDFLRCRVVAIDNATIRIEVQLGEIAIPRDRVAQIIWFHPDEIDGVSALTPSQDSKPNDAKPNDNGSPNQPQPAPSAKSDSDPYSAMAQIIRTDGNRVTFDPSSVDAETIVGTSDVVGDVKFEISQIDQIILGKRISTSAASLVFQQWRLHHAKLPLVAQDLPAGSSPDQGAVSPLVGKVAPDFELDFLKGGKFKLSKAKGKIVVLDFWATWCGPCMQTMPLVEEAMNAFDPEKVQLISVNLEEPAKNVQAVLERHKLNVPVVLDVDGIVGRKYEANAIPQLVIVGADGKIARLYVGGGPGVVTELTKAVNELLSQPAPETK